MHAFPPQLLEFKKYNFLVLISQDQLYVQVSPCFHLLPHLFKGFVWVLPCGQTIVMLPI